VRYFSRSYRCIAYNARGYPPSDVPEDASLYRWQFAVDDIDAVMWGLKIERAHLVGFSIGERVRLVHNNGSHGFPQAKVHRTLHHLNCEPGGICISSSAYDQVRGKVPIEVTDLGEQSLKNIARPVRAYSVVGNESTSRRTDGTAIENSPPALSIVVLPFTNIGGDPEQDYFVDGVTESLPQT
jgi:hypothetical protein